MERLWTIMRKEFIHIWRDSRTLALIIALPAILLVLLGYGVSGETRDTPLAVADLSKTEASRRYLEYYTASGDFVVLYQVANESEILELIDQEVVKAGILIPESFGRNLATGAPTDVQFFINGSDPTTSRDVNLTLSALSQVAVQNIFSAKLSKLGGLAGLSLPINTHSITLYNPNNSRKMYMIPTLIPIILQVQMLLLTALAIVREREQGTMEQLIVTPIHAWELMLGKILPYLLVGMFNTVATVGVGIWLFGLEAAGNLGLLIGLSGIFILGSLGMGVLVSNVSQSQMQAMYLTVGVILLPSIILSGLVLPRDNMPLLTYLISEILPVTHYLEITRGIMLKGVGFSTLWPSIYPLIILSVVYFVISVLVFKKRL